jgi:hypothetical protein
MRATSRRELDRRLSQDLFRSVAKNGDRHGKIVPLAGLLIGQALAVGPRE